MIESSGQDPGRGTSSLHPHHPHLPHHTGPSTSLPPMSATSSSTPFSLLSHSSSDRAVAAAAAAVDGSKAPSINGKGRGVGGTLQQQQQQPQQGATKVGTLGHPPQGSSVSAGSPAQSHQALSSGEQCIHRGSSDAAQWNLLLFRLNEQK